MPPSALQNMLTEGDAGAPFFSDRDGSERRWIEVLPLRRCLELLVERADTLGHRTVSVEDLRELLQS